MELTRRDVLAGSVAGLATIAGCGGDSEPGTPPPGDGSTSTLEVGSASISSSEGSCGSTTSANLTVTDSTVAILGSIVSPTPCHLASLEDAHIDGDALRFVVGAVADEDAEGCAECLASVPFEVTAGIERGSPRTVSIDIRGEEPDTYEWDL